MNGSGAIGRQLIRFAARVAGQVTGRGTGRAGRATGRATDRVGGVTGRVAAGEGSVPVSYRPEADGEPDPGEVVWAWVP